MAIIDKLETATMHAWRAVPAFLRRADSWDYRTNPALATLLLMIIVSVLGAAHVTDERQWRLGLEQHGVVASATVTANSGPYRRRQRNYVTIAWRDGATARAAKVDVSPGYLAQMIAKPRRTVTIRHRNNEAIIMDDTALSIAQHDGITPFLIILFVSVVGCLGLHVWDRWRKEPAKT